MTEFADLTLINHFIILINKKIYVRIIPYFKDKTILLVPKIYIVNVIES